MEIILKNDKLIVKDVIFMVCKLHLIIFIIKIEINFPEPDDVI